jgi:hypothetical protein
MFRRCSDAVLSASEHWCSDMDDGTWMTFAEASSRLGISTEALRRRADRGRWSRTKGNDGKTRVLVPETPVRTMSEARVNGVQTMSEHKHVDAPALVSALEGHIATLKAELAAERTGRQADQEQLSVARAVIDKMTAELVSERDRAEEKIAAIEARLHEKTVCADQAMIELVGERAARRAGEKLAGMRDADRAAQLAQLALRAEQLAAARAAADRATADLVALAQRLAAIAEAQQPDEAAPDITALRAEPPRRSRLARGWAWFLRN